MNLEQHSNIPKDHDSQMLQAEVEAWLAKGNKIKQITPNYDQNKGRYYHNGFNTIVRHALEGLTLAKLRKFAQSTQRFASDWLQAVMYGHAKIDHEEMKHLRYQLHKHNLIKD